MTLVAPRLTVASSAAWSGVGLHSGEPVRVKVHPGSDGLVFCHGPHRVHALAENVTDTRRCTVLGSLSTVEHLMSALCAAGVTDAEIEVEGSELPGLDGSALGFYEGLLAVGYQEIGSVEVSGLFERVYTVDGPAKIGIGIGEGHFGYHFDLESVGMEEQVAEVSLSLGEYGTEVSPARTLVFEREIEIARDLGLGRGLDESSVLVIGSGSYVNKPRFDNEPARHKLLDLIGDLGLSGIPLRLLNAVSHRSGHKLNVQAAANLASRVLISKS